MYTYTRTHARTCTTSIQQNDYHGLRLLSYVLVGVPLVYIFHCLPQSLSSLLFSPRTFAMNVPHITGSTPHPSQLKTAHA